VAAILARARDWGLFLGGLGLALLIIAKLDRRENTVVSGKFYVIDGDTLSIDGQRLRLAGIDAPELRQNCGLGAEQRACGQEARKSLAGLVGVTGAVECGGRDRDRYGRLLVDCHDGALDINAAMVSRGMAVAYGRFQTEERAARLARRGLWAGPFERPRDWRRRQGLVEEGLRRDWREQLREWLGLP
jgi:endonuclease YncB( thermonuclease family)